MNKPIARCICGYPLMDQQTCPECGRPSHLATLRRRRWPSIAIAALIGALTLALLHGLIFLMIHIAVINSPDSEAGLLYILFYFIDPILFLVPEGNFLIDIGLVGSLQWAVIGALLGMPFGLISAVRRPFPPSRLP